MISKRIIYEPGKTTPHEPVLWTPGAEMVWEGYHPLLSETTHTYMRTSALGHAVDLIDRDGE
jgi:hypothetical protein